MTPTAIEPISRRTHPAERIGYYLAVHPNLRRATTIALTTHLLAVWALAAAPRAAASTMAGALNWTGITDSHGVPVGAYFLSTVDTMEAITDGGPDLSIVNPGTWVRWGAHAITTGITHDTIASWIQAQASIYIFMLTAVLWLLRFAMSSTWLSWLATWFRPVLDVLRQLLIDLHVFPICLALGIAVGGYHIFWHGRRGHGATLMLTTIVIAIVGLWLTRDPLGELADNNGLLTQGRTLAFSVAQAATNNGPIATGGTSGQLSHLTGLLADALIRAPLQIWNFGTTIDTIGTCGHDWSAAILSGVRDAPAHAMQTCGAPQALTYARGIDGTIFALGAGFGILGLFFAIFVTYVTYSYIMVAAAAFMNAILAIFAAGPAMIAGTTRRRARRRLEQFFRHAFLVFVYVLYISCAAIIILKTVTPGGYATQVGMTNPVAQLVLVAVICAVATGLFWWLKRELLHDTTTHNVIHTVGTTMTRGRTGYARGQHTYNKSRHLADRTRDRLSPNSNDDEHRAGSDSQPRTNTPVTGRRPGGRTIAGRTPPHRRPPLSPAQASGPARTPSAVPAARTASTTAGFGAGEGAVGIGAAEAGAAVLTPEVVIPVAAALIAEKKLRSRSPSPHARRANPDTPEHFPEVGNRSVEGGRTAGSHKQANSARDLPAPPVAPSRGRLDRQDAAPEPVRGRSQTPPT
jgi:hypothetical protein